MKEYLPSGFRNWESLKDFPHLSSAEDVVKDLPVTAERLNELARAGYAPCIWLEGTLVYRKMETRVWLKNNLCYVQEGKDIFCLRVALIGSSDGFNLDDIPLSLSQLNNLQKLDIQLLKYPSAVYFLCFKKRVVYVGKSIELIHRVGNHKDKIFDSVYYLPIPESELTRVESELIKQLQPIYNIGGLEKRGEITEELIKENK